MAYKLCTLSRSQITDNIHILRIPLALTGFVGTFLALFSLNTHPVWGPILGSFYLVSFLLNLLFIERFSSRPAVRLSSAALDDEHPPKRSFWFYFAILADLFCELGLFIGFVGLTAGEARMYRWGRQQHTSFACAAAVPTL